MITFKTENPFQPLVVTRTDLVMGSMAFGFYFGFVYFVFIGAVKDTINARRLNAFLGMVWLAMFVNTTYACLSWTYLYKKVSPSLGFFVGVMICWIIQVILLQMIIANRTCVLYTESKSRMILKSITFALAFCIALSSAIFWIPAQLQISSKFISLNKWWDKFEKAAYLVLDTSLNLIYIRTVRKRLSDITITKFKKELRFTQMIICVSIAMNVLLLALTALQNSFVYLQFHAIIYLVKLRVEMSMSKLVVAVARSTGVNVYRDDQGLGGAAMTVAARNHHGHGLATHHHHAGEQGAGGAIQLTKVHVGKQVYTRGDDNVDDDSNSNAGSIKGGGLDVEGDYHSTSTTVTGREGV